MTASDLHLISSEIAIDLFKSLIAFEYNDVCTLIEHLSNKQKFLAQAKVVLYGRGLPHFADETEKLFHFFSCMSDNRLWGYQLSHQLLSQALALFCSCFC